MEEFSGKPSLRLDSVLSPYLPLNENQHTKSTRKTNTQNQHTKSTHKINTQNQHTKSTHKINTQNQHTKSTHKINTQNQHTTSTHKIKLVLGAFTIHLIDFFSYQSLVLLCIPSKNKNATVPTINPINPALAHIFQNSFLITNASPIADIADFIDSF